MAEQGQGKHIRDVLRDMPTNWGRWGKDDELGSINFLTPQEVARGARAVRSGKTFAIGVPVGRKEGDPIYPGRGQPVKTMNMDKGFYYNDAAPAFPGGLEYADDVIFMYVQGTTQYDALGHVWYDDKLYNGYDAKTTIGGLKKCSIKPIADLEIFMYVQGTTQYDALGHVWYDDKLYNGYDAKTTIGGLKKCSIKPIAEHGVVGRGVLLDVARYKGVPNLKSNERISL